MLANAGANAGGDDIVVVTGQRDGKPFRKLVDLPAVYLGDKPRTTSC